MSGFQLTDLKSRGDLREAMGRLSKAAWPEFMLNDAVAGIHWDAFLARFPEHTRLLIDEKGELAASCNAIPLPWDGETEHLPSGWDEALALGTLAPESKYPTGQALCALSVSVSPQQQGHGCGRSLLIAMKEQAKALGFDSLISPMRPSHKHHHPRLPMQDYLRRKNPDGKAEDPWLRTHLGLGARVLKVAPESMRIEGTLKEWSSWTKMTFGKSGLYEVEGALALLHVDLAKNLAVYVEPNVWVQYHL